MRVVAVGCRLVWIAVPVLLAGLALEARAQEFGVTLVPDGSDMALEYEAATDSYYRIHSSGSLTGGWSAREFRLGTNSSESWTDGGVLNWTQGRYYRVERVLRTNSLDYDVDGLSDVDELVGSLADPLDPDTDDDALDDGDEVHVHFSSPTDTDTDSDRIPDGEEANAYGTSAGSPYSGVTVYYPFNTNTQGWTSYTGSYGAAVVGWTSTGFPHGGCLAVTPTAGSGYADYYLRDWYPFDDCNVLARPICCVWIYMPPSAPSGAVRMQLWVKSSSDGWVGHWDSNFYNALPGQWRLVSWDMSGLSTGVLADVDEWAIKLCWDNRSTWSGSVFLDTLHVRPRLPATNLPPQITSVAAASNSVGRYYRFEIEVGLTNIYGLNPYDPDEVDLRATFISPSTTTVTQCGFYMEEEGDAAGGGSWRIRFAPGETGTWKYQVRVSNHYGTNTAATGTFTCVASGDHGWLRVSDDDPHYLEYDDDTPFFGIGYCRPYDLDDEGLFADAEDHGVNMLHVWMAPWDTLLTAEAVTPGGETATFYAYQQGRAAEIERMIRYAEQHDIKLVFTIWTHDAIRDFNHHQWRRNGSWALAFDEKEEEPEYFINAFSRLDDPPMNQKFFHDAKYQKYQDHLYRYLIARWGDSRAIGLWQLASELYGTYADSIRCIRWQDPLWVTNMNGLVGRDPYDYMDTNQVDGCDYTIPWITYLHDYFKTNDPFGHPTTACNATDEYWDDGFGVVDVAQIHSYADCLSWVTPPITLAKYHQHMRQGFNKPAFIGETGSWKWRTYQPSFLRVATWPALCSGAAIAPMMWTVPAFGEFCDPVMGPWLDDMAGEASLLARFVADIDFHHLGLAPAPVSAWQPSEPAATLVDSFESGLGSWQMFGTGIVSVVVSTNHATHGTQSLRMNIDMDTYDNMPNPGSGIKTGTVDWDWSAYWPDGTLRIDVYVPDFYHPDDNPDGFLKGINRDPRSIVEVACQPASGPWNWYSTTNEYGAEAGGWKKLTVGMLYNLEFRLEEIATETEADDIREIKFWFGDYGILRGPVYVDNITVGLYPYNTYGLVSSNGEFAIAWIQDRQWTNTLNRNARFQISGLRTGGTYNVEWWNSRRDAINSARNYNAATGTLYVSDVPDFERDMALKIRWVGGIGSTVHDVSVGCVSQIDWIVRSQNSKVGVTVVNQGTASETFDVFLTDSTDAKAIATNRVNNLSAGRSTSTTFTWNSTNASLGYHTLLVRAATVSGETQTNDNTLATRVKVVATTPPWDSCDRLRRWAPMVAASDAVNLQVSTNRATEGNESFRVYYHGPPTATWQVNVGYDNVFESWSGKSQIAFDLYNEGSLDGVQFQMRTGNDWVWYWSDWEGLGYGWNTNVTFYFNSNTWERLDGTNYSSGVPAGGLSQIQQIYLKMAGQTNEGLVYIDNVRLRN